MPIEKPIWGPSPEQVSNDKLNEMVEYSESYEAATPADWAGTPPSTIAEAIDRLAAQLATETGAPIP